ncbi:2Fe-2S iron-sulfur cluster-binding protein [Streptomyces marokkonensis]|uniref:2Fe-2S iron-sulfur cluster-binding protein n=1 Tax=Streptomyces marokkonensis TaxID=324855 RepID=UPI0011F29A6A|nr:2Fe-2S iron-sulfur cluster-binding protein [Streptomyces marokkonensis]
MTDDQHGEGTPPGGSRWDPLPQGDYDDGATAFVNLPEGGIDALLDSMESPLAAPGHGYVPPQITVTPATTAGTDPAATGTWAVPGAPVDGAQWHDPQASEADPATGDRFTYNPGATGQWDLGEAAAAENPAPGQDVTGQWSIPVADGDLPDESGEFTTSALVEQWGGGTPPATLPGGAPAPWAGTQSIGRPWGPGVPGVPQDPEQHGGEHGPAPERQDAGTRPHGEGHGPAFGRPVAGGYGERPDGDASAAGRTAYAGPAHGRPDGAAPPETSGTPGHGPERPAHPDGVRSHGEPGPTDGPAPREPHARDAHAGPHSSGVPQPLPAEGYAEPRWQPGAEAGSDGTPAGLGEEDRGEQGLGEREHRERALGEQVPGEYASEEYAPGEHGLREHPHPGAQDAAQLAAGPGETVGEPGGADGAPEAAGSPSAPSAADAGAAPEADPEADPEAAPDAGAPADATGTTEAPPHTSGGPDLPGEPGALGSPHDDHPLASYVLRVNGTDRPVTDAWIGESLLYVLRERLGLAGAKDGCSQGECGACNVQVDGRLVASCLVPAVTAAGSEVRTVEGLAQDGRPSDVQRALARCGAVQCGFCVPGMAMTVHDLLEGNPAPTELETRQALCGNLCRCSGYRGVVDAVKEVVAAREAHADTPGADSGGESDAPRIPHQAGPGAGGVNPTAFGGPGPLEQPQDQPHGQDGGQA